MIVQVQKIGISRGKNVFHGFHGSTVDFTGLPQKQQISRTRDTVKKEGPCPETAETIRVLLARVRIVDRELMRAVIQFVMVTPVPERMRASWMALKEIRSKAPSMSRNTPRA